MVFLPVYSSQIVVLKGVKTAAGIPLIHKQRSAARRQWFRCLSQTVMSKIAPMTRRTRSLKHFVLFRVRPVFGLFRCLWSVLQSYIINTPEFIWTPEKVGPGQFVWCAPRFRWNQTCQVWTHPYLFFLYYFLFSLTSLAMHEFE